MKSTLKYAGLLICVVHFNLLTIFNMAHVSNGTMKLFFMRGLHCIKQNPLCLAYSHWAGLFGGYGFYSPSVGNSYHIQFCRHEGTSKKYYNSPGLQSASAQMRFQGYLDMSSILLDEKEDRQCEEKERVRASVRAACQHLLKNMSCDSLEAKLITRRIQRLSQQPTIDTKETNYLALYRHVQLPEQYP